MKSQQEISYRQWNACLRKVAYPTRQGATDAAARLNRDEGARLVEVYRCEWCNAFHVGGRKAKRSSS